MCVHNQMGDYIIKKILCMKLRRFEVGRDQATPRRVCLRNGIEMQNSRFDIFIRRRYEIEKTPSENGAFTVFLIHT